jgi:hypothetical protein
MMTFKVTWMPYFLSHSFNHSKMVDVQNSEVDIIPPPFSLVQQWITINKHSYCNHGNEDMWLKVEQEGHKGIVGLKCVVQLSKHGNQGV